MEVFESISLSPSKKGSKIWLTKLFNIIKIFPNFIMSAALIPIICNVSPSPNPRASLSDPLKTTLDSFRLHQPQTDSSL